MTTTRLLRSGFLAVPLALVFAAALVGCSPVGEADSPEQGESTSEEQPAAAESTDDTEPSAESEAEPSAVETEEEPEPEAPTRADSGPGCVVGTWIPDAEVMIGLMNDMSDGPVEFVGVTGMGTMEFTADGKFTYTYDDWTITAKAGAIPVTVTVDGVDTGSYNATADTLQLTETNMGSTVTMRTGETVVLSVPSQALTNANPYACQGDTLKITVEGVESTHLRK